MKKLILIISLFICTFLYFGVDQNIYADTNKGSKYLNQLKTNSDIEVSQIANNGKGIQKLALNIADAVKRIFYIIAIIYFLIITIKLIVTNNTEEEVSNFKKGILWISLGIVLMNIAVFIVNSIFLSSWKEERVGSVSFGNLANNLLENIIQPFISLLEFGTAFFFIIIMIYAFFRLVTSNGDEEKAKTGKMTVLYAIIGFVVVKIAATLVFAVYGSCKSSIARIFGEKCNGSPNLSGFSEIIFNIINWMNSFVAVAVIILIIFIGAQIIFSNGDEEKITKAKKSIIYIVIGIAILLFNYMILTFFL